MVLFVLAAVLSAGVGPGNRSPVIDEIAARESLEHMPRRSLSRQAGIHQTSLPGKVGDSELQEVASVRDTIISIITSSRRHMELREAEALARIIVTESHNQGFDPLFVTAVIKAESTFRHSVVSHKGARGLMQLLPSTGRYISEKRQIKWEGGQDLYDPALNIRLGLAYLRYLEEKFDFTPEETLIAYNWGPGNLLLSRRKGGSIPSVSRRYAQTILSESQLWQRSVKIQLASLPTSERA